ncbi:MAG TPA: hypothetical protein VGH11_08270 [Jatrophihabitans sp.]|jgi:hypothetical protein
MSIVACAVRWNPVKDLGVVLAEKKLARLVLKCNNATRIAILTESGDREAMALGRGSLLICPSVQVIGFNGRGRVQYQTRNQRTLADNIAEFQRRYVYAKDFISYLARNEIKPVRVERGQSGRWLVFCVLAETSRTMFDIDREVLFVVTDYPTVEPRLLGEIQGHLRDNARLDNQVAVLLSLDEDADRIARQRVGETVVLTLNAGNISAGTPEFRRLLADTISSVDHFNVTTPLTSPSAFFGRERDIAEARRCLGLGQHLGIFGLRKAGKSSLLNRLSDVLKGQDWAVANLDLNEYFGTPRIFKSSIVRTLAEVAEAKKLTLPRLVSASAPRRDIVNDHWLKDLGVVVDALGRSAKGIVIMIDEIDTSLPGRTLGANEEEDELGLLRALAQLRAFIQRRDMQGKSRPVLLCAGVDPGLFERPKIRRLANPLYQFASIQFIKPMDRDELQEMVRTLGKRTGMRFREHELIDRLLSEYGGHPLLTRQACSFVHRRRPRAVVPYQVTLDDIDRATTATGPGTPLDHALDVPASFEEWYPEESALLDSRLESGAPAIGSQGLDHAVAYGILNDDGSARINALLRRHDI